MESRIFKASTEQDLERCFPVMKQLRPHLSYGDYRTIYDQSHAADGYEIVAMEWEGRIVGVMGYRFLSDYVRGRHLYIDDLVTSEGLRSQGIGAQLLKYAEKIAAEDGCKSLRLATGIDNSRGIQFYQAQGWALRSHAFVKKTSI